MLSSSDSAPHDQATGRERVSLERPAGVKRYTLVLPDELFNAVQTLANQRQTTVVELIRRFIKLGLIAARIEETPGAALIIREGDIEREIVLI